jgi:hypothetical protein
MIMSLDGILCLDKQIHQMPLHTREKRSCYRAKVLGTLGSFLPKAFSKNHYDWQRWNVLGWSLIYLFS